jgi:hypothetical protein
VPVAVAMERRPVWANVPMMPTTSSRSRPGS